MSPLDPPRHTDAEKRCVLATMIDRQRAIIAIGTDLGDTSLVAGATERLSVLRAILADYIIAGDLDA